MTRDEANDILILHKYGLGQFPATTINNALRATGDLIPTKASAAWDRWVNGEGQEVRVWRTANAGGNSD